MNCPSRTDPEVPLDWNQSPNSLNADATTRSDLSSIANARTKHDHRLPSHDAASRADIMDVSESACEKPEKPIRSTGGVGEKTLDDSVVNARDHLVPSPTPPVLPRWQQPFDRIRRTACTFMKFVGPGFMIAVAYIDPGNYATDAAAGATYQFKLLFMVLLSNIFAIFLQSLCIKMSTVTGRDLAQMNKDHCPPWLNYVLYFFGECAVIATDIAEVIGFAIALNLLAPAVPIVAGCAISILDVMFILLFYRPEGSMKALRIFEGFVMILVLGVVVCFCFQMSLIEGTTAGHVLKGYLPSRALVESKG
jgi:metal iron transporter